MGSTSYSVVPRVVTFVPTSQSSSDRLHQSEISATTATNASFSFEERQSATAPHDEHQSNTE